MEGKGRKISPETVIQIRKLFYEFRRGNHKLAENVEHEIFKANMLYGFVVGTATLLALSIWQVIAVLLGFGLIGWKMILELAAVVGIIASMIKFLEYIWMKIRLLRDATPYALGFHDIAKIVNESYGDLFKEIKKDKAV